MAGFFSKLLRAGEGRQVKGYEKVVARIGELEPSMQALSDEELAAKTIEFRERLERGETPVGRCIVNKQYLKA